MNVLVINCGSSSLKYQLINSDTEEVLAKGLCERIGIDGRLVYQKAGCDKEITEASMPTHKESIQMVMESGDNETGSITLKMNLTYHDPGKSVTVTLPDDLNTYQEISN